MKTALRLLLISAVLASSAAYAKTAARADNVIGTINGENVYEREATDVLTRLALERKAKEAPLYKNLKPEEKAAVLKEIATRRLLKKEVAASKIAEEKTTKENLEKIKNELLQREFLSRKIKPAVTPEKIKAQYDEMVKSVKDKEEFKLHHILVSTEKEANEISENLAKNPNAFEEIAKNKSKDASSVNGGDMGYLLQDTIMKEIQEAVLTMKKDQISAPIQTSLGWHIIRLDDRRKTTIVPLEKVKDKVEAEVNRKALQAYFENLIKDAKINVLE